MKITKTMKTIKRHVTLIEMMIVMFLIAMIIGVIAYNYQGSLDEGKAFKTKAGMEKLKTILTLKVSDNPDALNGLERDWREYVKASPLVQNPDALIKDGWGKDYEVKVVESNGQQEIEVTSDKYNSYKSKGTTMFGDDHKNRK
jgi:type II secretory pathway pseudopilin PulG